MHNLASYQFYHEFTSNRKTDSNKTCIAVRGDRADSSAIGAKSHDRQDVGRTSASTSYLMTCCLPVSEADARRIHPDLFRYLDSQS